MAKTNKKLFAINKPNIKRILETRVLNQAVRRNIDRFPEDFMFPLTREEIMRISQIVTSSGHPKAKTLKFSKSVMSFTEHGVAMLSSVLSSPRAVQEAYNDSEISRFHGFKIFFNLSKQQRTEKEFRR